MSAPNSFTRSKGNCPVCNGARKDCRMNGNLYFCRTDSSNSAFILKSHDKIGFGIYIEKALEEEQDAEKLAKYKRQREAAKKLRLERETKDRAQLLSVTERDQEIRKILGQLTLNPNHREDLKRRGLSDEQIEAGMFRSVSPYQKLQIAVSSNLAGVSINTNGRSLTNTESGYICPAWSGSGLIVGWQLRLDNTEDNGKYKWPTSRWRKRPNGPTSHLQNGEMPITVCRPEVIDPSFTSIGLAEGILKPKIAAELTGQFFLGAAGGLFASSPKTFKQELDKLLAEFGTKLLILYADAGSPGNKDVMREYAKTYRLVTSWGYELRIGWWGQLNKSDISGIDDLLAAGEADKLTYLAWEDFEQIAAGKAYRLLRMLGGIGRRKLKPAKPATSGVSNPIHNNAAIDFYFAGERLPVWEKAVSQHKFIVDSSGTGTGKSYDSGLCEPSQFDCDRIIYISNDHRNASTPSLKSWEDLEARHKGLTIDNLGNWRRAKGDDRIEAAANCDRTELSAVLREKNISGSDTAGLMCPTCPHFEGCRAGEKFGFLQARTQTLKSPRFRSHPDSLPPTDSFGYAAEGKTKGTVLVWEEWSESLKYSKDITVEEGDITHIMFLLLSADSEAFGLTDLLVKLCELVSGKHQIPRWGLPHERLLEILLPLIKGNVDVDAIAEVTNPNDQVQAILHGLGEHGVSLQDLPANLRKSFASSDANLADKAQKIAKQWLKPFLQVITGNHPGYLNLNRGVLSITVADRRLIEIAHAAKANIFLDATGSPEKLALMLGIGNEGFLHIQQATSNKAELIIKQIVDHGRLGISRGAEQVRAIEAIVAAIRQEDPAAVIDFKKFTSMEEALNLKWFSESRGSNLAQSAKTLILVGTPCRPIATLAAEFTLLYGRSPNITSEETTRQMILSHPAPKGESDIITSNESVDIEFRGYIYKDIHANINQAMGRLRANRRAGETLTIYFISNFVLDMPVELVRAVDICLEAATPIQKLELAIARFAQEAMGKNCKLTLTAIADFCKVSKQRLSQFIRELGYATAEQFKKRLVLLLESHSKTRQNSKEYIPLSAEKQIDLWAAQIGSLPKSVIFALLEGASKTLAPPQPEPAGRTGCASVAGTVSQVAIALDAEPEAESPIAQKAWGWFQRKLGEWIKCRVLEFVEGRYLLEAKSMVDSGMVQFRAYPEDLRWEAPIC